MKIEDIKKMAQAWNQVQEATYGKKKEAMDPVDTKELKGKHKDRKDKDIDNDGDVDKSDKYLHKRRKAVSKAIKGKETETEVQTQEGKLPPALQAYMDKKKGKKSDDKKDEDDVKESVKELDELSKKTLGSYVKKADKQANKAADSYSNAAMRRSDFAPDTPAMAKNAKKFAKRDAGADLARKKLAKESVELDEISKKTLGSYINKAHKDYDKQRTKQGAAYDKAARTGRDDDEDKGHEYGRKADNRTKGIKTAVNKLTKEAKDHGNTNNGSPAGEGLSPSAKKELARTTPMPDAVNQPMVDKKTFDAIRASGKKAPMRSNDNAQGDKTAPKTGK